MLYEVITFRLVARPKKLGPLILSKYEPGMSYGTHVDHPISGGDMRRDVRNNFV